MAEFYVRVVVHATVPAETTAEAFGLLCERIREGIGPDTEEGREWGLAIAAGRVQNDLLVNEEFLRRLGREHWTDSDFYGDLR